MKEDKKEMVKIKKTLSLPHLKRCGLFSGFLDDPKSKTLMLRPHSKECCFRFMDINNKLKISGNMIIK